MKALAYISKRRWYFVAFSVFALATITYLWPMFIHPATYSEGGDHMFNAWTLARDHHCLLRQGCEQYVNGNIFFPNKDSMLYSETQFSAGLLTLPLYLLSHNPLFVVNIWYLISAFLGGLFMYFLALYLSKGNQSVSILAGLIFEFAPTKITSMSHLQNLSIFYLPLIILMLLKYRDTGQKRYLAVFTLASSLLFLASWYQMIFGLVVIFSFVVFVLITSNQRRGWLLLGGTMLAILTTLPLAKEYVRFSKTNNASFSISEQASYASGPRDYVTPQEGTPFGALYYKLKPNVQKNGFNSDNYSYAGVSLYVIAILAFVGLFYKKTKSQQDTRRLTTLLIIVGIVGVIFSFGPLLKWGSQYVFHVGSYAAVIPAPYILVDKFIPQLSFIRAIGRASIILLFALCCILAISAPRLKVIKPVRKRNILLALIIFIIAMDLLPITKFATTPFRSVEAHKTSYTLPVVYQYIRDHKPVDNLIVLRSHDDYPTSTLQLASKEDILWAGYHNKNIFNGYSGYQPPSYQPTLQDFVDLQENDVPKMKAIGLDYILIDKQLSDTGLKQQAIRIFTKPVFEDNRYALYKI